MQNIDLQNSQLFHHNLPQRYNLGMDAPTWPLFWCVIIVHSYTFYTGVLVHVQYKCTLYCAGMKMQNCMSCSVWLCVELGIDKCLFFLLWNWGLNYLFFPLWIYLWLLLYTIERKRNLETRENKRYKRGGGSELHVHVGRKSQKTRYC